MSAPRTERPLAGERGLPGSSHADGEGSRIDVGDPTRLRDVADFEPVEFKRGEWKSFDTYATDFLANTAALPGAVVGAYSRIRAACCAYGTGWSLRTTWSAWTTHAGAVDRSALESALCELEQRDVVIVERGDVELTVADPSMHGDLIRKQRARERQVNYRERRSAGQSGANGVASRVRSRETSRALPPSSSLLPPSSTSVPPSEELTASPDGEARPAGAGPRARSDDVDRVIDHYRKLHPRARPGEKERRLIAARLLDGFSVDDLIQAINGNHTSPFHRGENDRNRPYQSLELIVRDGKHVQDFIEVLTTIENPTPGIDSDAVKAMVRRVGIDETRKVLSGQQDRSLTNGTA